VRELLGGYLQQPVDSALVDMLAATPDATPSP
jgi:hypothetical protein